MKVNNTEDNHETLLNLTPMGESWGWTERLIELSFRIIFSPIHLVFFILAPIGRRLDDALTRLIG